MATHKRLSQRKAVVLLSGGLDSATVLFYARSRGYDVYPLTFRYGQRHAKEIRSAMRLARASGSSCVVVPIRFPWGGSSLLDKNVRLPQRSRINPQEIPSTYVPGRNTIFLSFALSYAEAIGAGAIFIGANAVDYSGYPDCRPAFFDAFTKVAALGTKAGVEGKSIKIIAPLLRLTKAEIIKLGHTLNVPYALTWSCYSGGARPCGTCDSCVLRRRGFEAAGLTDPAMNV
jgi:7-cyano-7-deazaguanine synthase